MKSHSSSVSRLCARFRFINFGLLTAGIERNDWLRSKKFRSVISSAKKKTVCLNVLCFKGSIRVNISVSESVRNAPEFAYVLEVSLLQAKQP